jgi:hypothetical protein
MMLQKFSSKILALERIGQAIPAGTTPSVTALHEQLHSLVLNPAPNLVLNQ